MTSISMRANGFGPPPYLRPVREAIDRMQQRRQTLSPDELQARAQQLLRDCFGTSEHQSAVAFARGSIGLLAEQTHYSDGFAVLMPLVQGTAVALRPAERSRVTFEGSEEEWTLGEGPAEAPPVWVCLVEEGVRRERIAHGGIEVAVVSTIPAACLDAYLTALGVATTRAADKLHAAAASQAETLSEIDLAKEVRARLTACTSLPFSIAYPLASVGAEEHTLTLVDTATKEYLSVEAPAPDVLGWGLISIETSGPNAPFHQKRKTQTEEALIQLRGGGFEGLEMFRDLEHRDLPRALDVVSDPLKPIVRYLVTENRRVQKLIAAVRHQDWQFVGALLLMSQASLRDNWKSSHPKIDFVTDTAEALSMEGIYGTRMTGRGRCVLVVGQSLAVPEALDSIAARFRERFGSAPETILL